MTIRSAPYAFQRNSANGSIAWDFRFSGNRKVPAFKLPLPADLAEPWYSPAYMAALTRMKLRPGKIREVLRSLPYSLARCIGLYKTSGELARRSPEYQMWFDRSAETLCMRFGWVDARQLTPGGAAFLTSRCDRPQDAGTVLNVVLAHAARQGIGTWTGRRRILPKQARTGRDLEHSRHPVNAADLQPMQKKVIRMPNRQNGTTGGKRTYKAPRCSRINLPERAVVFADVVANGAVHGWPELTVPHIMAAAFRMGIKLPSERVTQNSLNLAVELGLIQRTTRSTYGAIQHKPGPSGPLEEAA